MLYLIISIIVLALVFTIIEKKQNERKFKPQIKPTKMDYSKIDNIVLDGINTKDAPDFCDSFIVSADYDGKPMTEEQLDEINDDGDFVYNATLDHIY